MLMAATGFVVFDYYETGEEGKDTGDVQDSMDDCAGAFLAGGVGGLEDEDGLGG